jgi:two-component system response regulator RegX3
MRVALLEDDSTQAELLSHWLASAEVLCRRYDRGESLLRALRRESFDALVLEWSVPDMSGIRVLQQVRGVLQSSVPVLFVSASEREVDIVTALQRGADDYMVKPIRPVELLARLEAIVRRGGSKPEHPKVIDLRALHFNCQTRTAWRDDQPVHLTAKDFDLAVLFARNVGRLLSRAHIRDAVWGPGPVFSSRTLYTHVCHIRDKLGLTPPHGWRLAAVYGHGYRLDEVATSAQYIDRRASALSGSRWSHSAHRVLSIASASLQNGAFDPTATVATDSHIGGLLAAVKRRG